MGLVGVGFFHTTQPLPHLGPDPLLPSPKHRLQNENFTATAPFMTSVGNHESTPGNLTNVSGTFPLEFAAFSARYRMPRNGNANYWRV